MCDSRAGSQRCGNHRGLGDFSVAGTCLACVAAVDVDAIRALSRDATATAINSLYFAGIAPSATAALSNAQNAFITSGARVSIFFNLARLSFLYIFSVAFNCDCWSQDHVIWVAVIVHDY